MKDNLLIIILVVIICIIILYIISCKRTRTNNEKTNYNLLKNKEKFEETQEPDANILAINDLNINFNLSSSLFYDENTDDSLKTEPYNDGFKLNNITIKYISFNDLILNSERKLEKNEIEDYIKLINKDTNVDQDDFDDKLVDLIKENIDTDLDENNKGPIRIIKGHNNKPEPLTYLTNNLDSVNAYLKQDMNYQLSEDENFKKHDYFIAKRTGEKISEYRPFTCFYNYRDKYRGKSDYLKSSTYSANCNVAHSNYKSIYGLTEEEDARTDIKETKDYFNNNEIYLKIARSSRGYYNIKLEQDEDEDFESYFYDLRNEVDNTSGTIVRNRSMSTFINMMNNTIYLLKRVNIPINKTLVLITEDDQEIEINKSTNHIDRSNANLISSGHPNICEISMDDISISLRKGFIKKPKKPKAKAGRIFSMVAGGLAIAATGGLASVVAAPIIASQQIKQKNENQSYDDKVRDWKMASQKLSLDSNLGICKKEYTIKDAKLVDKDVYLSKINETDFTINTIPQDFKIKITNSVIEKDFLIYNNERTKLITKNDNGLLSIIDTSNKDKDKNIKNYIFNKDIHINDANKKYYKLFNDNIEYIIHKLDKLIDNPTKEEYLILYEDSTDNYNYKFLNSDTEKFELYNPDNKDNYKFKIYLNNNERFKNINGIEHFTQPTIAAITTDIIDANINSIITNYKDKIYTDKFFIKKDTDNKIVNENGDIMFYDTTTQTISFKDTLQYSEKIGTIYYDEDKNLLYYHNIDNIDNSNDNNSHKTFTNNYLNDTNNLLPKIINTEIPNDNNIRFKPSNKNLIMKDKSTDRVFHCIYKNKEYNINILNNANEIKYYALYKNNELIEAYSPYFYVDNTNTNTIQFIIPKNIKSDKTSYKLTDVISDININDYLQLEKSTELTKKINCLNGSILCPTPTPTPSFKINDYNETIYEDYNYYSLINIDTIQSDKRETTDPKSKYNLGVITNIATDTNKIIYNIDLIDDSTKNLHVYFEYRENPITNQLEPEQTSAIIRNIDLNISEKNTYNNNYLDELQKINTSIDTSITNLNSIKQEHMNKIKQIKSIIKRNNNTFLIRVEISFIPLYKEIQLLVYELYEINKQISKISYLIQNKVKFAVNIDNQTNYLSELETKKKTLKKLHTILTDKLDNHNNKKFDEIIKTQIHINNINLLIKEIKILINLSNISKETFEDSQNNQVQLKYDEYNDQQSKFYEDNIYNLHINLQIKNNEQKKLGEENKLLQKLYDEHYLPISLMLSNSNDNNTYNYHLNTLIDNFNIMKKKLEDEKLSRTTNLINYKKEFKKQDMVSINYKTNNLNVYNLELEIDTLQNTNNELNNKIYEINKLKPFNLQSKLKKLEDFKYTLKNKLNKYDVFEPFTTASSQFNNNQLSINTTNEKYKILMNGKCLSSYKAKDYKLTNCNVDSKSQYFSPRLIQDKLQAKNINKDNVIPSDKIKYPYYQIRSSLSNDCVISDVDGIKITPCSSNNIKQQWKISKNDNICINN